MPDTEGFVIRCRAVIVHEGKLLVVRHAHDASYAALPGGHLEYGEDLKACLVREIEEELGVRSEIGRLLYVHTFLDERRHTQPVEFFFEVTNGADFVGCEARERSHAFELARIEWISPADDIDLLPNAFEQDFKNGTVFSDTTRYISFI